MSGINPFDDEYFRLASEILYDGETVPPEEDRTGFGYINKFNTTSQLDLRKGFPLLTTKRIDYEAVKAELFWMLSGSTNVNDLPEKYRFIWAPWADKNGDLGPIYQSSWLQWQSDYGVKINQISLLLRNIKDNPLSRRHVVSAWNVSKLDSMALPPCHILWIFNVSPDKEYLDLQVTFRSNDFCVGKPYNWAQYATLLHMIAKECNKEARYLYFSVGSDHIYLPHVEKLKEQVTRTSHKPPSIVIKDKPFWKLTSKDIQLVDYTHEKFITYKIAI